MNSRNQQIASTIYERMTPARERAEANIAFGLTVAPVVTATVEEIAQHIEMCEEVGKEYGVSLSYEKVAYGATIEDAIVAAEKKAKNKRKRAGVEALKAKYGKEAAERIIQKHTGHKYNLQ